MYGWALAAREEDLVGHEHQEAGGELKVVWGGRERGCLGAKTWWHRRFPGDTGVLLMKRSVSVCQSSDVALSQEELLWASSWDHL